MTVFEIASKLANGRGLGRWEPKAFDKIQLKFTDATGKEQEVSVKNLSAFGALVAGSASAPLTVGMTLKQVRVLCSKAVVGAYWAAKVVHVVEGDKSERSYGLMFLPEPKADRVRSIRDEARAHQRVMLQGDSSPHAWCRHPLKYDTLIHFKLRDISLGGARLMFATHNDAILRGARLDDLHLLLPTVGEVTIASEVVSVDRSDDLGQIFLSVRFDLKNRKALKRIAKFAMVFSSNGQDVLADMRAMGDQVKGIKSHVDFVYVQSPDEYKQVLELRRDAYKRSGKVPATATTEEMADVFDNNSVLILARVKHKAVGSVRVTYCRDEGDKLELDASGVVPAWLPRSRTIEVSRLCVAHDFEGTDLSLGLMERCTEVALKLGATWAVTSSVDETLATYTRMGFQAVGKPFRLRTLNAVSHRFLLLDMRKIFMRKGINPLYWHLVWGSMVSHLARYGIVDQAADFSRVEKVVMHVAARVHKLRTGKTLSLHRD